MADITNLAREAVEAFNVSDWERTKALMTEPVNDNGTLYGIN